MFKKYISPQSCESPLRIPRHALCKAVRNSETNSQRENEIHRSVSVFALVPTSLQAASRSCYNIAEHSLCRCQYRGEWPTEKKQHSNCKNFSEPLATGSKFVHSQQLYANSCM